MNQEKKPMKLIIASTVVLLLIVGTTIGIVLLKNNKQNSSSASSQTNNGIPSILPTLAPNDTSSDDAAMTSALNDLNTSDSASAEIDKNLTLQLSDLQAN